MWAHLPDVNVPHKMADTAREGVFMGMSEIYKGVIFYCPLTHDFDASTHATFEPGVMPMLALVRPSADPSPLPPPLPLPPLFVPSSDPIVAPVIPAVPLPMATPERAPVHAAPRDRAVAMRGREAAMRPLFAPPLLQLAPPVVLAPPPVVLAPPPAVAMRPIVAPPPLQPAPPVVVAPAPAPAPYDWGVVDGSRRSNSRWQQVREDELNAAASAPANSSLADSLSVVVAWLAATWHPPYVMASKATVGPRKSDNASHVALLIFSGLESPLVDCLESRGARVIAIDIAVGGRLHDLTDVTPDGIGWHLRRAAQRGEVQSLHAAVPCETFSVALDDADMVRSWPDHSMGLPRLSHARASKLFLSNVLVYFTIDLATDVWRAGARSRSRTRRHVWT